MNQIDKKAISAGKTIELLGYTWQGGELWKPPLGKMSTAEHDNTSMLIAWDLLKLKLAPEKWTVSDHFNSQGFFAWGWEARKQYDIPMQTRITELEAENERLIKVSLFKENVAGVLRAQLETEQAIKDARKQALEEFKFRLTLLLDSSDYYAVENIDQYHIEADAMKGLLND